MPSSFVVVVASVLATAACKREETSSRPDEPPNEVVATESSASEAATTNTATHEPASVEPADEAALRNLETEQVCRHMLDIWGADLGELVPLTTQEQEDALDGCYVDLEHKRAASAPEAFDAKVKCVLAAGTVDQLVACG